MTAVAFRCFRVAGAEHPTIGDLIRAAWPEAARVAHMGRRSVPVYGVIADGQVGAGAMVHLGEMVAEGGDVGFTDIEPDAGEEVGLWDG